MAEIIDTDVFDKAKSINIFRNLIGMVKKRHDEILADPIKFFDEASKVIGDLHMKIEEVRRAAFRDINIRSYEANEPVPASTVESMIVTKEDYECLMAVRELLK